MLGILAGVAVDIVGDFCWGLLKLLVVTGDPGVGPVGFVVRGECGVVRAEEEEKEEEEATVQNEQVAFLKTY